MPKNRRVPLMSARGWMIEFTFTKRGVIAMSGRFSFAAILTGSLIACLPAFAQSEEAGRSEVSAQFFGTFVHNTNQNGIGQSSSDSGGVLATYRFFFSKHSGVEANYAYSRNTTAYNLQSGSAGVNANQHEWTGAYVFRVPMRRLTPFAEAGVGGLTFAPTNSPRASTQTRAAFVYGAGTDLHVTHRVFIRAQYRGFVYNSPTFNEPSFLGADRVTHLAEPSIGLGLRL
jgi:outer membrane immunogenic protein